MKRLSVILFAFVFLPSAWAGPLDVAKAEFARYVKAITGHDAPSARFAVDGTLDASHDAYRIRSEGASVAFVGANERAVLYAVYDFLSRRGGCRWFWDGDVVPKRASLDYSGLDVCESSRFEYRGIRYFAHRGLTRFQAEHWGLADWKREIDWCVKNRLNVMMPRIGMDDIWQKAFPETVPYPDPTKPLPEAGKGYDNRSLFWPLDYRGELRRAFTAYARERGLMVPTDSGTLTHWYSRTPLAFLAKENPPFIKQAGNLYAEQTGLVFDVTQEKWMDKYWRLSEAAIENGYGDDDLLHTVALGERMISTNRAENLAYKVEHLRRMFDYLGRKRPEARLLFAGWDLYNTWLPEEVRALIPQLDPNRVLIWDYEGDSDEGTKPGAQPDDQRNFTRWGLVGKFPYTFGIFLAYENALDVRANYPLIAAREAVAAADPMCKGYLLWPESSHTDILLLSYFTTNSWRPGTSVETILPAFCRDRYGDQAAAFESVWRKVLPVARKMNWWGNYATRMFEGVLNPPDDCLKEDGLVEILQEIADLNPEDDFQRRDAMDLARTVADRLTEARRQRLVSLYADWRKGSGEAQDVETAADAFARSAAAMADLLAQHADYSLYESLLRLKSIEPIRLANFDAVLLDNADNFYCRSHQYEAARHHYAPYARKIAECVKDRLAADDRSAPDVQVLRQVGEDLKAELLKHPLADLRPTAARTREDFRKAVLAFTE